jgi:arylsulfatase A-like enzyme
MKNVVLLFADDMRYGLIDNPEVFTPHLDRLASRGVMFKNAHIPGGSSGAVCMPSRAMLHTGRLLEGLRKAGRFIPVEHALLGEVLAKKGYSTYGIGKWHNGPDSYARSFNGGAEIFFGGMEDHWNVPANDYDPTGRYAHKIYKCRNPYLDNATSEYNCDHITPGKHSSDLFADASTDFLDKASSGNRPFFLYTAFMAPHDPRTMPREFLEMYDPDEISLPENYMPLHPFDFGISGIRDEKLAPYPREEDEIRKQLCEYYAMVSHLDSCVGRIMDSLDENGLKEETILIFAADNGLGMGSHGLMGKQNLYEHSIRVPLIVSGPGMPQGHTRDASVFIADIFPTILDLLDIETPDSCTTQSFADAIYDEKPHRDCMHFRYKNYIAGLKRDGYKLIKYMLPEGERISLFNINEDPFEVSDLSGDPAYSEVINAMLNEIESDWTEVEL